MTSSKDDRMPLDETPAEPDKDPQVAKLSRQLADLNTQFCDHFSQQLKEVFASTVPDFPRLEQPEALLERLEHSYLRHVDVVEVYAARNIFTLDNLPVNRRARIAQLYQTTNHASDLSLDLPEPEHFSENVTTTTTTDSPNQSDGDISKLTAQPPPTPQQVEAKRAAVQKLHEKIAAARQEQALLQRRLGELEIAQHMATWSDDHAESTAATTAGQVQESVSALMVGVHGVEDCREQGEAALQQQAKKRRLSSSNQDGGDADRLALGTLSPPPPNVHALYAQERQRVQTTVQDLQHVHKILVANKKNPQMTH